MSDSKSLFGDYHEMAQGYKHLTSFSWFPLFNPVDSTMQKINPVGCFNLCRWRFVYIHLFPVVWRKSLKSDFQRWRKNFSIDFALFFVKWLLKYFLTFRCAKRFKDWTSLSYNSESSKLAGSKLARFHVCLHSFQCTPDQNNTLKPGFH